MPESSKSGNDRAFPFLRVNDRPPKPRSHGVTEIRGPYYTPVGKRYLEDVLDGIEHAPDAIAGLYRGENLGKRLIRIA